MNSNIPVIKVKFMSLIWWDHGAFASLGFPALATADDKLVSLGAPEA
jgi:hypothetical protein